MQTMNDKLNLRAVLIGTILSMVTAMSAVYLALRMNSFYWASIFTSLMSLLCLKLVARLSGRPTDVHEVNITQTMASVGGILAAGVCFTIPALYFLDETLFQSFSNNINYFIVVVFFIGLFGGFGGVYLSSRLRSRLVEEEALPFPTGIAAADTIKASTSETKNLKYLMIPFILVFIYTSIRDGIMERFKGIIPFFIGTNLYGFNLQLGLIPMTLGGGYLIGFKTAMTWLAGCLISNWIFQPILLNMANISADDLNLNYILPMGVGLVIGSGVVLIFKTSLKMIKLSNLKIRPIYGQLKFIRYPRVFILVASSLLLSMILKVHIIPSLLAIIGLWLMTHIAARMSGETNIDPMEILAVAVVIVINLFFHIPQFKSIMVAAIIAVSVGVAADLLFDYKAGYILETKPSLLTKAQLIGVVSASAVVGISLVSLLKSYQLGSPDLFALQSQIVAYMLGNINWYLLLSGLILGVMITLSGFSGLAFGVGFFIPMFFTTGFAIGGVLKYIVDKKARIKDDYGRLISAGLIGGEGVAGTIVAIFKMLF